MVALVAFGGVAVAQSLSTEKKAALETGVKVFTQADKSKKPLFNCQVDKVTCKKFETHIDTVVRYSATHALYNKDPGYELSSYGALYDKMTPADKAQYLAATKEILQKNVTQDLELKKQVSNFCDTCKYKALPTPAKP